MKKGFTLTELLTVIAILVLLAAVVIPNLNSMRIRGRDTKRISDLKELQVALERYYDRTGNYPNSSATGTSCDSNSLSLGDLVTQNLISSLPTDPINSDGRCYVYIKNRKCTGALGPQERTGYVLLFKPERIDTFGGANGGEHSTQGWMGGNGWLCVSSH